MCSWHIYNLHSISNLSGSRFFYLSSLYKNRGRLFFWNILSERLNVPLSQLLYLHVTFPGYGTHPWLWKSSDLWHPSRMINIPSRKYPNAWQMSSVAGNRTGESLLGTSLLSITLLFTNKHVECFSILVLRSPSPTCFRYVSFIWMNFARAGHTVHAGLNNPCTVWIRETWLQGLMIILIILYFPFQHSS